MPLNGRASGLLIVGLLLAVLTGVSGCGTTIEPNDRPRDARILLDDPYRYDGRKIDVTGYLASGLEHAGFGPTMETARGSWIWVKTGKTAMVDAPEDFWDGPTTQVERVTIRGSFHAGPDNQKKGYGHLGMFDHKIVADTIVFRSRRDSRLQ